MYSKKMWIRLLFLSALLTSCSPAETMNTPASTPPTKIPVQTSTNTPMPSPTPSFDGPKLVYSVFKENFKTSIEMINKDGTGSKTLLTPKEGEVEDLPHAISPDGKWLAFHTGTEDDHNLTLNILSISSGEKRPITYLLSKDYPNNFQKAVDKIQQTKTDFSKEEISVGTISMDFGYGIRRSAWSPNSRYLAFAGEMDGPTSDLYVYDIQEKTITRLTDDLLNISYSSWSPDGKQIYFNNGLSGIIYSSNIYYVVDFETKKIRELDIPGWGQYDACVSEQFCLSHFQGDGGDPREISLTNMSTEKSKTLWAPSYQDYAIAANYGLIAVSGPYADTPTPGTYFIDFDGHQKKISDLFFGELAFLDSEQPVFIGGIREGIFTIDLDGNIQKVYDTAYYSFSISPDKNMFVAYRGNIDEPESVGLILFAADGKFVRLVDKQKVVWDVIWRPDSQGLFYEGDSGITYYLPIPNGEPKPIQDVGLSNSVWIP